jgi:hypothetical protein
MGVRESAEGGKSSGHRRVGGGGLSGLHGEGARVDL